MGHLLRASSDHILSKDPFKLACLSLGVAPVLVPLRPSSEHILIVRAPGARDQHGCHAPLLSPLTEVPLSWL
jgi:hypothetical protein